MTDEQGRRRAGEVTLEVPARPEYLQLVRSVVAAAASVDARFTPTRVSDLRLAVSEAATNAMESHAQMGSTERVVVRCQLDEDRIEVEVRDQGAGFDESMVRDLPDPTDPARLERESGLGVPLMRILADEAEIHSEPQGTSVRLVVYVPPGVRGG